MAALHWILLIRRASGGPKRPLPNHGGWLDRPKGAPSLYLSILPETLVGPGPRSFHWARRAYGVPQRHTEGGFHLGNWVSSRRMEFKKGKLLGERIADLAAIKGWVWEA